MILVLSACSRRRLADIKSTGNNIFEPNQPASTEGEKGDSKDAESKAEDRAAGEGK